MALSACCLPVLPCLSFFIFFLLISISEFLIKLFICVLVKLAKIKVNYAILCIYYEDTLEKVVTVRSLLENQFWFGKWSKLSYQCKGTSDQISKSFTKELFEIAFTNILILKAS